MFVASQCAFGVDVPDWLKSDGYVSVRREEDWPVSGADGPRGRSQDCVAERRALQNVMRWMVCGSSRAESQWVWGCSGGHCCRKRQRVGQQPGTQSFGEILGEGQRRLKTESITVQDKRERRGGGVTLISFRRSTRASETTVYHALL